MCTNGINTGQFEQMIEQIDDHIKLERRWAHNLGHMAGDAGFATVSEKMHAAQAMLDDVRALLDVCARLPHVRVRGLMTMAPQGDPAAARAVFEGLANLHAQLRAGLDPAQAALFDGLSMGMSEDWHEAIAEGATIVRIGRALFDDAFEGPAHA